MTSTVDSTFPADNVKTSKATMRSQFLTIKDEISVLQQRTGVAGAEAYYNAINVAVILNMTAARFLHSNSTLLVNPETAAAPTGATALLTVSPAPFEYYLSAGDTVTYTIATLTMVAMNMQVVGTEIDV